MKNIKFKHSVCQNTPNMLALYINYNTTDFYLKNNILPETFLGKIKMYIKRIFNKEGLDININKHNYHILKKIINTFETNKDIKFKNVSFYIIKSAILKVAEEREKN